MPKKYGVKEKDLVVSHVVNLVLTGKLRSGDRVDRNEIAQELGLSRVPIQEAVVQLEHDGILSTPYHRGAYVERFDESVVREHHELYGLLSGLALAFARASGEYGSVIFIAGNIPGKSQIAPLQIVTKLDEFRALEADAQTHNRGLWAGCNVDASSDIKQTTGAK